MKITILDRLAMGEDLDFSVFCSLGEVEIFDKTASDEVIERIKESDLVLTNKVRITAEIMDAAKNLKLVCVFATGFDNIDVAHAKERGIAVCNVPAYSTESVTLFTLATALSLYSHLFEYREVVMSGEYSDGTSPNRLTPVYHEIKGKTWGILGCGNIGRRVAEVAKSLGCRVIVHQRHEVDGYENVTLEELLEESDILSLHCPLTEQTRGIIGKAELSRMKKSAILINEARGAVCDEEAVAQAVVSNAIGGFGSDVYSVEPFGREHPFYQIRNYPNVCLTPHAAWGSYESRLRALNIVWENMSGFLKGQRINRVD